LNKKHEKSWFHFQNKIDSSKKFIEGKHLKLHEDESVLILAGNGKDA
jgi:hypothetical protein